MRGELTALLAPARAFLNPIFDGWRRTDATDAGRCSYSSATLLWTVILGFMEHRRSRNAMDVFRNCGGRPRNIMAVSGQRAADGAEPNAACSGTVMRFLKSLAPEGLAAAQADLVGRLVKAKVFKGRMKILGMLAIAVDGTLRERKRGRGLSARERNRMVLEAKVVTPQGWAITVMSEHLDPWDDEREKQDCELRAFGRLAGRLKARFRSQNICILGDALYACRPVADICEANGWSYILTAKEARTPAMMAAAAKAAARRGPEAIGGERRGEVRWATAGDVAYETGDRPLGSVVFMHEQDAGGNDLYDGAFVTNITVRSASRAALVADWGRRRWNIEDGFHTLKGADGFGLEHSFCNDENAGANMHTLMTIAHTLWQLLHTGYLRRLGRKMRKVQQINWAALVAMAMELGSFTAGELSDAVGTRRMRFLLE